MLPASFLSAIGDISRRKNWLADFDWLWKAWWDCVDPTEHKAILDWANGSEVFAEDVRRWAHEQWPDHPGVGDWLLYQMSGVAPFPGLRASSGWLREVLERNPAAVYGVAVPDGVKGCSDHVWLLYTWLVPNLDVKSENKFLEPLNLTLNNSAMSAGPNSKLGLEATLKKLTGPSFWWWFWREGWRQARWGKWLVLGALALCISLLVLLAVVPGLFLRDDAVIAPWIQGYLIVAGILLSTLSFIFIRQWTDALKDLKRWLDLLEKSRALIAVSQGWPPAPKLPVRGASYSVTLALTLLLALEHSKRARSDFFQHVVKQVGARTACVHTGWLGPGGSIEAVKFLDKKYEAASDCKGVRAFAYSSEGPSADAVKKANEEKAIAEVERDSPERKVEVLLASRSNSADEMAGPNSVVFARAGSAPATLPQLRFGSLSELFTGKIGFRKYAMSLPLMTVCVVIGVFAIWAAFDFSRLIHRPAIPALSMNMQGNIEASAELRIFGSDLDQFAAVVTSTTWQSLPPIPLPRESSNQSAIIKFKLVKPAQTDERYGRNDGTVELIRNRSLLWRDLPPAGQVSIATFNDLIGR